MRESRADACGRLGGSRRRRARCCSATCAASLGLGLRLLGIAALDDCDRAGDERDDECRGDDGQQPAEPPCRPPGKHDVGVAGLAAGLDERALKVGHRSSVPVERLDRRFQADAAVELGVSAAPSSHARAAPERCCSWASHRRSSSTHSTSRDQRVSSASWATSIVGSRVAGSRSATSSRAATNSSATARIPGELAEPRPPSSVGRAVPRRDQTAEQGPRRRLPRGVEAGVNLLGTPADGTGHAADIVERLTADHGRRLAGRTARSE